MLKHSDDREASREAKLKTKECRYAAPVDGLLKAFGQKAKFKIYRTKVVDEAEHESVSQAVQEMGILALRQRMIDKDPAAAADLGLPFWWNS